MRSLRVVGSRSTMDFGKGSRFTLRREPGRMQPNYRIDSIQLALLFEVCQLLVILYY